MYFSLILVVAFSCSSIADLPEVTCRTAFDDENVFGLPIPGNPCYTSCYAGNVASFLGLVSFPDNTSCQEIKVCSSGFCVKPEDIQLCKNLWPEQMSFGNVISSECNVVCMPTEGAIKMKSFNRNDNGVCETNKTCFQGRCVEPAQVQLCRSHTKNRELTDVFGNECRVTCVISESNTQEVIPQPDGKQCGQNMQCFSGLCVSPTDLNICKQQVSDAALFQVAADTCSTTCFESPNQFTTLPKNDKQPCTTILGVGGICQNGVCSSN